MRAQYWTRSEVSKHRTPDDLLVIVKNKVYDVSDYVDEHPGGAASIARYPGEDCTEQFSGIQHPAKVWDIINVSGAKAQSDVQSALAHTA